MRQPFPNLPSASLLALILSVAAAVAQEIRLDAGLPAVTLPEVTVTARRLVEPLQRLPFSVSVIGRDVIQDTRADDASRFALRVPGLNYNDFAYPSQSFSNVRGVGALSPLGVDDTAVPVYVDGLPMPSRAATQRFADAERIEVLRGPQGTLFGRNAQAGAINITTVSPFDRQGYEFNTEIGRFLQRRVDLSASALAGPNFGARVSASYFGRDGYIPNTTLGTRDVGAQDTGNLSTRLEWRGERSTATLTIRGERDDRNFPSLINGIDPGFPRQALDRNSRALRNYGGIGLTLTHDLGWGRLTSITGLQYYDLMRVQDVTEGYTFAARTGLPVSFFNRGRADLLLERDRENQFNQELRLDGRLPGDGIWLVGTQYLHSDFAHRLLTRGLFGNGSRTNQFTTDSVGVFGESTQPLTFLTDRLRLTAGLRYTHEARSLDGQFDGLAGSGFRERGNATYDLVTGRIGLSFDITPRNTAYATFSSGARAGGFPADTPNAPNRVATTALPAARTLSYETGLRGTVLEGRLQYQAAAFLNQTSNENVTSLDPGTLLQRVETLDTRTYGVELELTARPVQGLTLSTALGVLNTRVTGIPANGSTAGARVGNRLRLQPDATARVSANYSQPLPIMPGREAYGFVRADYLHVGQREADLANSLRVSGYNIVNTRVGVGIRGGELYVFAENLFDQKYVTTAATFGQTPTGQVLGILAPGLRRVIGLGLRATF